jgi:hypothetical protein
MSNKLVKKVDGESGNVLIITLLILFAIAIIGSTIAMVSTMDLKISGNQRKTSEALFIAEAGLTEAIHRLSLPDPTDATIGGWTGNIAIGDSDPYDPNWTTLIYLDSPASVAVGSGSIHTTGTIQDPNEDYLEYSMPSGTESVLRIQHKWIDRNGDGVRDQNEIVRYDQLAVPPENFVTGFPVEVITVTGSSADGERVIQAEVAKETIMVRTLAALYVDKAIEIQGHVDFCGYNHSIDTPVDTETDVCDAWHLSGGSLPGVTATGDVIKVKGAADIFGFPVPVDNSATNPFYTLPEVLGMPDHEVNDMLANADNTSIVSPLNGITCIEGDAQVMAGLVGEGLLYVKGDLKAAGDFSYTGLIYVEGDVFMSGDPWILGSMIVRGTSDFNFSSGNAAILYSQDAILRALLDAMPTVVLSWREL